VQAVELPAALALALLADLVGARQRHGKDGLQFGLAGGLAPDVADHPAKPGAQEADLAVEALR
jgi:hypothetical protein